MSESIVSESEAKSEPVVSKEFNRIESIHFEVGDILTISDICGRAGTTACGELEYRFKTEPGKWTLHNLRVDLDKWGIRNEHTLIWNNDYEETDDDEWEYIGDLCIDGGAMDVSTGTASSISVMTGLGDGAYPVEVVRAKDGSVVRIAIEYFDFDDEDEATAPHVQTTNP